MRGFKRIVYAPACFFGSVSITITLIGPRRDIVPANKGTSRLIKDRAKEDRQILSRTIYMAVVSRKKWQVKQSVVFYSLMKFLIRSVVRVPQCAFGEGI